MTKLYPYQSEVLEATKGLNRVAYYLEMGLGKTFIGSEKILSLNNKYNLIICQKSKIDDWKEHFKNSYQIYCYDLTKKSECDAFIKGDKNFKCFGLINYELAWRRPELNKLKDFTLLLDESSLIQNAKAKQSKFILGLKPSNVVMLSGTPCGGRFENLWTQSKLLGWDITKRDFEARYINFELLNTGSMYVRVVSKSNSYKNVEELKQNLRAHGAVFMKTDEVIELPQQLIIKQMVGSTKDYKKFKKDRLLAIGEDEAIVGDTALTYHLRLRQLASQYSQPKLSALKDLLDSTSDRLIIFYNFVNERESIIKLLGDRPISRVDGELKDLTAYEREENSVTLIQYQAGAMGLNLQLANKVIYFSLCERSELFEQSKKRIHRIGQYRKCLYYVLLSKDTIDTSIYEALEHKRDYTDYLFKQEYLNG